MPILIALITFTASATFAEDASSSDRQPVPKSLEQEKAEREIRTKYKSEFAARDPGEQLALAHKLREEAAAADDLPTKFVLLREARDLAVKAGDFQYALATVDALAKSFAIDAEEMKASALSIGVDISALPAPQLVDAYLKVADDALEVWNVDLAHKSAYLARKVAKRDAGALAKVTECERKIAAERKELAPIAAAAKRLKVDPDDPEANLIIGRHLCVNTKQWDAALPYLAKSPDGPTKDAATKDTAGPTEPDSMAAVADLWWDLKDAKANIPPAAAHARAAYWYAKALPGLTGEKKAIAEKRIAEGQ
ncbi:MAG TPA: hypothetical protein VG269_18395 [Tepidisphaeraceae bacterium]|nr:hypothetical protein [Tepidisphaeraceae bacterium]